jgi:hypothetical protein
MSFYKFIKTRGEDAKHIGYYVPRMYRFDFSFRELKIFGFKFVKERLDGWTIWWVDDEEHYINAVKTLDDLRRTHMFNYKVSE